MALSNAHVPMQYIKYGSHMLYGSHSGLYPSDMVPYKPCITDYHTITKMYIHITCVLYKHFSTVQ